MKKILQEILQFIMTAIYMMELIILIPIGIILKLVELVIGREINIDWMVNWFYDYIERTTTTKKIK